MKKKKIDRKIIIAIIAFILFIITTILLLTGKNTIIDNKISEFIIKIRNDKLNDIMVLITNICSLYSIVAISLLMLIIIKNKRIPLISITNLVIVTIISLLSKLIIQRPRPVGISIITETGYSYPSGHSMVSMAFFGLLAYLIYKELNNKTKKIILIVSLILLIILIGFSRIYLGVHYFTDVLGGFFVATGYLMIFITHYNYLRNKKKKAA